MAPIALPAASYPQPSAVAELLKPITWFPPMWAFGCGVVASGQALEGRWGLVLAGILLAGPFVCATSQAVNDWFDRHVDAINEPQRPIPSGRMPGRWGLYVALIWTGLSLLLSLALGPWGFGAAVMAGGGMPPGPSLLLAGLYSLGAHGIMTLNDFKSIEGDRRMGIASLPVQLGPHGAALSACVTMALSQAVVIALLAYWDRPLHALAIAALLAAQLVLMRRFVAAPVARAVWFSGLGVTLYVVGMLVSAFALRGLA